VSATGLITARAGGTATITVTTSNGLKATCVVTVNVPTTKTFTFQTKGKQGANFTNSFDVTAAGNTVLTVSVPNKSVATIIVLDSSGQQVFKETFVYGTSTRFVPTAATGKYTVRTTVDTANGNTKVDHKFVTP